VALSASAVAYSSTRIENMFMSLGTAAGVAAQQLVDGSAATVQDVNVTRVQQVLVGTFAQRVHGRVSTERILCGDGLGLIHRFTHEVLGLRDEGADAVREGDANKRVVALAKVRSPAACAAVRMFAGLLGAELGNVALRGLARGGVFLSGGLGAAVLGLERQVLLEAFGAKGRFRPFVEALPLALVARTDIGLDGSARLARDARD
jgi:glucokinase